MSGDGAAPWRRVLPADSLVEMAMAMRLLFAMLVVVALPGCCCGGGRGKTQAMIQCRSSSNDQTSCKACCTRAGGSSAFYSKSMGCECN